MFLFVVCVNMLLLASNLNKQVLELLINLYIPNVLGGVLMKFLCYLSKYKYIYIYISLNKLVSKVKVDPCVVFENIFV